MARGKKQSEILKAQGDAKARITPANAEAEAIKLVSTAAETYFKERTEMMRHHRDEQFGDPDRTYRADGRVAARDPITCVDLRKNLAARTPSGV